MNILKESLFIFDNITFSKQKSLKIRNIKTWEDLYLNGEKHFSDKKWNIIEKQILECVENYTKRNLEFFKTFIDERYHFILLSEFSDYALYMDIETSGLNDNEITLIGLSDNKKRYKILVRGINLVDRNIINIMKNYKIIVTFFGKRFDIPLIKKQFPYVSDYIDSMISVDLYYLGRMVGFKGGLKKIERQVGIRRPEGIEGLTGYDAIKLWKSYLEGDLNSLIKLIRYNREDTINLVEISKYMLEIFYEMYIKNYRAPFP
ncbi:MAG: ribonuclease H-like domain-containing protein [Thermoplasmata archaeon]